MDRNVNMSLKLFISSVYYRSGVVLVQIRKMKIKVKQYNCILKFLS